MAKKSAPKSCIQCDISKLLPEQRSLFERIRQIRRKIGPVQKTSGEILRQLSK